MDGPTLLLVATAAGAVLFVTGALLRRELGRRAFRAAAIARGLAWREAREPERYVLEGAHAGVPYRVVGRSQRSSHGSPSRSTTFEATVTATDAIVALVPRFPAALAAFDLHAMLLPAVLEPVLGPAAGAVAGRTPLPAPPALERHTVLATEAGVAEQLLDEQVCAALARLPTAVVGRRSDRVAVSVGSLIEDPEALDRLCAVGVALVAATLHEQALADDPRSGR